MTGNRENSARARTSGRTLVLMAGVVVSVGLSAAVGGAYLMAGATTDHDPLGSTFAHTGGVLQGLDFETFRRDVEPIFVRPRPGFVAGEAACVSCHSMEVTRTPLLLQPLNHDPSRGLYWTEEESRLNFDVVRRLIDPENPAESRLLVKPLQAAQGGAPYHTGGKYWDDTQDPEYQVILDWINAGGEYDAIVEDPPVIDLEFFAQCVQRIFIEPIPDAIGCVECHTGGGATTGFANRPSGNYWTESESLRNFEVFTRLLEPGHPDKSLFLYKPLHPAAGGALMHNGGRRWMTTDDPEWQMFASWVRGERTGSDCTP